MRKDVYVLGGTALLLVIATAVGAGIYLKSKKEADAKVAAAKPAQPTSVYVRPHSHTKGPSDAKVTIVEFLDPECETCRLMYPVVKHLLTEYDGKIRVVVRYMPFHQNSMLAIAALEAAAEQGKYWELLEALFARQPEWGDHHHPKPDLIPVIARDVGLDMTRFDKDIQSTANKQKAEVDQADGRTLGVTGTPTFFVNGKMLERLGYEPLKAAIDEALK